MACLAEYVIGSILAHDRQAERRQMYAADDWQLMQLGGVSGRIPELAVFGLQGMAIVRRARALGLRVVTVFRSPGTAGTPEDSGFRNLTKEARYLVLPRARAVLLPDRRPIAAADIVVLGPRHSSIA